MERYQTPRLFSVAFQSFCSQFQLFSVNFFFLACWSFFPFSFSTELCLPVSPDSGNPMFQGHTVPGEAIFCCQPASLCTYRKMGPGRRVQLSRSLQEGERKHSRGSTLGQGTACLPRKGVLSCACTSSPLRMSPPTVSICSSGNNPHFTGQLCR